VWLNREHGPALTSLPFDLFWATTWEEEANTSLALLLGLTELPYISPQISHPTPDTEGPF
jgi:hypothetical protein